jgi:hypothetical protein
MHKDYFEILIICVRQDELGILSVDFVSYYLQYVCCDILGRANMAKITTSKNGCMGAKQRTGM